MKGGKKVMFWLIISILSGIIILKSQKRNEDGSLKITNLNITSYFIVVISFYIFVILGSLGVTTYPNLIKKAGEIHALANRVQDIRNSSYSYKTDGGLVAGSIENYKQSTNLSTYISNLAKVEADYNGSLETAKASKELFILNFFGRGWAISDKIYELEIIG